MTATNSTKMPSKPIVSYFQRKIIPGTTFSLEFMFENLRWNLRDRIDARVHFSSVNSRGVLPRIRIAADAAARQGDINHVAGDIHFATAFLRREKSILTILDTGTLERLHGIKKQLFKFFWYTLPIRQSAFVTTISNYSKVQIQQAVGTRFEIHVIPVPISDAFQFKHKPFDAACPRILIVGTLPNKNVDRVMEAVAGISCKLHIVGRLSSVQIDRMHELKIDYVNYVNLPVAKMVENYELCDILAFCSTYEGFGMPIVEANSVGRVVITSNVCSMPEVATNAACLVDPTSVEDIRNGILRLIRDRSYREQLIENGFKNATRFQPDEIANGFWSIYSNILRRNQT